MKRSMEDELSIGRDRVRSRVPSLPSEAGRSTGARNGFKWNPLVRTALITTVVGLWTLGDFPPVRANPAQTPGQTVEQQERPANAATPEPLIDDGFFDEARERLAEAFRLDDFYAYQERRTDINSNPFGRLGTGDLKLYQVYPSPTRGLTYRRLIAANGEPLLNAELARQDREYQARSADIRRRLSEETARARLYTQEEQVRANIRRAEQLERSRTRAREQIDDIVDAMQLTVERREIFEGRPSIVVTFWPHPDAAPQTRRGDLARKFAGTAWIDEAEREVRYVEAVSVDSISFGLGLAARIRDGAVATMRREKIDDSVWLPTSVTLNGSGRAMLFLRAFSLDYSVEWFDYRPADDVPIPGTP